MDTSYPYEKLGLLYLGRELDINSGIPSEQPLLYKNKNMTTHGVIIGMTGSGKTGLGISLIEEAIMDNIPSIIIDPKGDMGNLLLTFPNCTAEDFAPWIDPTEAAKIRKKYQTQQDRLEQQLNNALDRLEKEKVDVKTKTTDSLISFGVAVVGAFFGRKAFSAANIGKAATGMRSVGRVAKEKSDVKRVEQDVKEIQSSLQDLAVEIEQQVTELADSFTADNYEIETFAIKPRRSDIFDVRMVLLWEMVA